MGRGEEQSTPGRQLSYGHLLNTRAHILRTHPRLSPRRRSAAAGRGPCAALLPALADCKQHFHLSVSIAVVGWMQFIARQITLVGTKLKIEQKK